MPLYAVVNGQRERAIQGGPRRASCAECETGMIAKTGTTVIHHWAHQTQQPNCAASEESEWHLGWKLLGIDGTQEIAVGNRRADVLAPGGFAVEFQKSHMSPEAVTARETDWKGKLVWVFDAQEAYTEGRLAIWRHPDRDPADAYRHMRWTHAPVRIRAAKCRSLLDLDGQRLICVGKWFDRASPMRGYGWEVTLEWCVSYVVQGKKIPELPGFEAPVDSAQIARKAKLALAFNDRGRQAAGEGGSCPLCHSDHASCSFTAGSLFCIVPDCRNPHHRTPAEEASRGAS